MKKLLKVRAILLILILIVAFNIAAKGQYKTFTTFSPVCDTCYHKLDLKFEGASFFQNNEYFNSFTLGKTGIGVFILPELSFYFKKNLRIDAGIFLLKYSGKNKFTNIIPIFTIQYRPAPYLDIVLGSIYGTLNHQLAEPLFRYDRYYTNPVEYGMQFILHKPRIWSDIWLNWEHYVSTGDAGPEKLTGGTNTRINLISNKNLNIQIPFQTLVFHSGGQFENKSYSISTIINSLSGIKISLFPDNIFNVRISQLFLGYYGKSLPPEGVKGYIPFNKGWAGYTKLRFNYKSYSFMTGYWHANNFFAPKGEFLFQSLSEYKPNFYVKERNLWTTKLWFHKQIGKNLKIEARFSTYYDLISHKMDISYGFYLILNQNLFLLKYKY